MSVYRCLSATCISNDLLSITSLSFPSRLYVVYTSYLSICQSGRLCLYSLFSFTISLNVTYTPLSTHSCIHPSIYLSNYPWLFSFVFRSLPIKTLPRLLSFYLCIYLLPAFPSLLAYILPTLLFICMRFYLSFYVRVLFPVSSSLFLYVLPILLSPYLSTIHLSIFYLPTYVSFYLSIYLFLSIYICLLVSACLFL